MAKQNQSLNEAEISALLDINDSSEDEDFDFDEMAGFPDQDFSSNIDQQLDFLQGITVQEDVEVPTAEIEDLINDHIISAPEDYTTLNNTERIWKTEPGNLGLSEVPEGIKLSAIKEYNNSSPIDYFLNVFEEATPLLVQNTNTYARIKKIKFWTEIAEAEMKAFLGIIIMMGLHPLPQVDLYWSSDEFYRNPTISKIMPCKRFKKILEAFHVSDDINAIPRGEPGFDKLQKVRPFITLLNKNFQENAHSTNFQSIDESMVKYKGRNSMKQYMPKKPIKRGFKVWARCDSKSGYLYQFDVYKGKMDSHESVGLGYKVVSLLTQSCSPNTIVAFDNFFTSIPLVCSLSSRQIYSVGTFRTNRKWLPEELLSKNKQFKLEKGQFLIKYSEPIAAIKWRDTKDVFIMTTAFNPKETVVIQRTQKDGSKKDMFCPLPVVKYTEHMGGVDRFDHYRSSYSIGRKSRKYWFRLFYFLFESAVINAYILHIQGHDERKHTHRDFRLRLARSLVNNFTTKSQKTPASNINKKGGVFGTPEEVRLSEVGRHMPINSGTYRRCRFCSSRKVDKRSKLKCQICDVPLCATPCFAEYHK